MKISLMLRLLGFYWQSDCNYHHDKPRVLCDYCRQGRYRHPLADLLLPTRSG